VFDNDEILQLHEIPSPPVPASNRVTNEVMTEISSLTSEKSFWLHLLRALWPFGKK
jgi:hypothetical protein